MRKQVKRYFRRSLCGILSAAMIAASLIAPDMTVYAAPQDAASLTTENEDDKLVDETTGSKEEGEDKDKESGSENPGGSIDGDNENAGDKDSENGGESGGSSEGGNGSGEESGDNSDGDDKENPAGDDKENPDEEDGENPDGDQDDLTDDEEDGKDEDLESDDEEEKEEDGLTMSPMANEDYGTLQNGDFEEVISNDNWKPAGWTGSGDDYKTEEKAKDGQSKNKTVHWYTENGCTISLSQIIDNIEPGVYVLSLDALGVYAEDSDEPISIKVKRVKKDDSGYTDVDTLINKSLGEGTSWEKWNTDITTEAFVVSVPSSEEQVNLEVKISGKLNANGYINIDDVELTKQSKTLAELKALLEDADKLNEDDYTVASWSTLTSAKTAAQALVTANSTDATEITLAYAKLETAMKDLVEAGMIFYYYVGESSESNQIEEVGLCLEGANISAKDKDAQKVTWQGGSTGTTYQMTATDYAGWYSIPLRFAKSGTSSSFSIYTYDGTASKEVKKYSASENAAIYNKLAQSSESVCAVKGSVCYEGNEGVTAIIRQVTLYIYGMDAIGKVFTPYIQLEGQTIKAVTESNGQISELTSATVLGQAGMYAMTKESDSRWYSLTFSAPGSLEYDGAKMCTFYKVEEGAEKAVWVADFENGPSKSTWSVINFDTVFKGKVYYYKGTFYASKDEAKMTEVVKLKALIKSAEATVESKDEYIAGEEWNAFEKALADAKPVAEKELQATDNEIEKAYNDLSTAMDELVPNVKAEIKVTRVKLAKDFITGADISSYYALKESGVVFKDEEGNPLSDQGFFDYLYEGGMNWARIRIWNDPYNSSGKGYGGGNNDLEKAKIIGKWATDAGMRVLIDFHYSDFWADPAKQKAPKAWAAYDVDQKDHAIYDFTLESLRELSNAGVDVGMVQVGNETNNGICGETDQAKMAQLFNAGSRAVRAFEKESEKECLIAVHFTNPQDKGYAAIATNLLKDVDYDVFASSFYPFGHGDTANLQEQLEAVATATGKKVMVAETSWPTTLTDGDGYGYVSRADVPADYADQDYGISVQGQADEMRDLIAKVNAINNTKPGTSLGVFYWEPAWISPYYIKDEEGNDSTSLYKQNFDLWEKYGSGWASSYAAEYDPEDAGVWYGGSAMDNSSWFDFDGTALPTAKIYSLIRTGASSDKRIATVNSTISKEVTVGTDIAWPVTVDARYNDGEATTLTVTWDEDETELVNLYKVGEYTVHGIATDSETGTGDYKITLKIRVVRSMTSNILVNPGFETGEKDPWTVVATNCHGENNADAVKVSDETPHNTEKDAQELHFYAVDKLDITVSQTVENLEAGTYTFGGYIQGGGAEITDVQYAYVTVKSADKGADKKEKSTQKTSFTLNGWKNWCNPEITGISVEAGDSIEVGLIIKSTKDGTWGSIDDLYLYGTHTVSIDTEIEHGSVTANVVKADSGERVSLTVTPDDGYYPTTVTLSGSGVLESTLTSSNGEVKYEEAAKQAVLTYNAKNAEEKSETFTMPKGNVTVSATFVSVFEEGKKIRLKDKGEDDKYLVQVNGIDSEKPIEDQYNTGKNITPAVELSYMGYKLSPKDDYTIAYANNKDIGSAKITLTAKSTSKQFEGTREINFNIVQDTRKEFKDLKVIFKNPDKGDGSTAAKSTYYLGKQKELRPEIVLKDSAGEVINKTDSDGEFVYEVFYQNNKKIGKATVVVLPTDKGLETYKDGSVTTTFTIAKCPVNYDKVSVEIAQPNQYYTGKKVEPAVTVKLKYTDNSGAEKTTTLTKGTDYTVAYGNNTNATQYDATKVDADGNPVPKNLASIKITGKGNFTGTRTTEDIKADGKAGDTKLTFVIKPRSITNATITAADLVQSNSGTAPKVTVKDGTKAVASSQYVITKITKKDGNKDEIVYTYDQTEKDKKKAIYGSDKLPAGKYTVTVAGKNNSNYTGEKTTAQFEVKGKEYLISNAKITVNGKFYFTGSAIKLNSKAKTPELKVVAGSGTAAVILNEQTSANSTTDGYYVTYENNVNAGKATITITGTGAYVGKKTATFTIGKRALAATIKDTEKAAKGVFQTPKLSVKKIQSKLDGTWTSGTSGNLINEDKADEKGTLSIPYTGYTLNPEFTFSAKNYIGAGTTAGQETTHDLSSGDYTVSYSVGKWENGKAPVTATVKGKGNYSGSVKIPNMFTLTAQDLKQLNIEVNQINYDGGKALKPSVTFSKPDGTVVDLKLGTAYTLTYKNNKLATLLSLADDKKPKVTVKVKGNGWIIDKTTKENEAASKSKDLFFNIDQQEIVKTDVADIAIQTYKGKALTPAVTIKVNGKKLKAGTDYTVTYSNNIKRSGSKKGEVTIVGKGNYFTRNPITMEFVIK